MAAIPHPLLLPQHLNVLLLYWIQISSLPVRNFNFRLRQNSWAKFTFCVPQQCSSPSVSKSLSWQHDWPWKYYFPYSKISRKISVILENSTFLSKIVQFFKIDQVLGNERFFPKLADFSSEKMISYFWWICSWSTACVSFDMSWSIVTTCSNTIWEQWIIGEELWWEWNTRIICLKKLVLKVVRKILEHFLFWLVLSIQKCRSFWLHMVKIICWAKCQLSAIKRP